MSNDNAKQLRLALELAGVAMFGVPMNISVCYITLKYRKSYSTLRSNTSILIMLNSLFGIAHQSAHFIYLCLILSGIYSIPANLAFVLYFPATLGFFFSRGTLLSLSADRLFSLAFPIIYRHLNQRLYIIAHLLALVFIFSWPIFLIIAYCLWQQPNAMLKTFEGELVTLPGSAVPIALINFFVSFASIVFYMIVGLTLKCIKTEALNERMRKLYRSLFLIVAINIGGYMYVDVSAALLFAFNCDFAVPSGVMPYFLLLDLSAALSAPILYFNSMDFKKAYQKEFQLFCRGLKKMLCPGKVEPSEGNQINIVPVSQHIRVVT